MDGTYARERERERERESDIPSSEKFACLLLDLIRLVEANGLEFTHFIRNSERRGERYFNAS